MHLTLLLFDGFTSLDAIGGCEALGRIPGMTLDVAAMEPGIIANDTRRLGLVAFRRLSEVAATDVLYVPGGPGAIALESDERLLAELRRLDATTTWTVGICNGVGLLGAAGLLRGRKATTNWFYRDRLRSYGAEVNDVRYQRDGKYVTGAGVSASIDTALALAEMIAGTDVAKTLQLGIEYYPSPPFPERTPAEAPPMAQMLVQAYEQHALEALAQSPPFAARGTV